MDCGDPGNPYGGFRQIATNTKYQSKVTYTCKPDHHLEGDESRTCLASGQYSGSKPVCLGMYSKFVKYLSDKCAKVLWLTAVEILFFFFTK